MKINEIENFENIINLKINNDENYKNQKNEEDVTMTQSQQSSGDNKSQSDKTVILGNL